VIEFPIEVERLRLKSCTVSDKAELVSVTKFVSPE
jgi:hypothetical protein